MTDAPLRNLPTLNALLNATAAVLLVLGWRRIRRGDEAGHKRLMLAALYVSTAFLVSYVIYHASEGSRPFTGPASVRPVYLTVLATHVVLAAFVPFLAIWTVWLGLRDRRATHRRVARWTFPIWLYVSVTGVLVYVTLYHLFPGPRDP